MNSLGKWKTALQMVGISSLCIWRDQEHIFGPQMGGASLRRICAAKIWCLGEV